MADHEHTIECGGFGDSDHGNAEIRFQRVQETDGRLRADNRPDPVPDARSSVAAANVRLAELRPVPEISRAATVSRLLDREARGAAAFGAGRALPVDQAGRVESDRRRVSAELNGSFRVARS